jgi:hypothetical protein
LGRLALVGNAFWAFSKERWEAHFAFHGSGSVNGLFVGSTHDFSDTPQDFGQWSK